jgi:hypothetical protein
MSMPASSRSFIAASTSAGSASAVAPLISAFSPAASRVGIGIVFTVSGATRLDT